MAKIDWRYNKTDSQMTEPPPMSGPYRPINIDPDGAIETFPYNPIKIEPDIPIEPLPVSGPYVPNVPVKTPYYGGGMKEPFPIYGPYNPDEEVPITRDELEAEGERKPSTIFLSDNRKGISVSQDPDDSKEALAYFGMYKSEREKTRKIVDPMKGLKFIQP